MKNSRKDRYNVIPLPGAIAPSLLIDPQPPTPQIFKTHHTQQHMLTHPWHPTHHPPPPHPQNQTTHKGNPRRGGKPHGRRTAHRKDGRTGATRLEEKEFFRPDGPDGRTGGVPRSGRGRFNRDTRCSVSVCDIKLVLYGI